MTFVHRRVPTPARDFMEARGYRWGIPTTPPATVADIRRWLNFGKITATRLDRMPTFVWNGHQFVSALSAAMIGNQRGKRRQSVRCAELVVGHGATCQFQPKPSASSAPKSGVATAANGAPSYQPSGFAN